MSFNEVTEINPLIVHDRLSPQACAPMNYLDLFIVHQIEYLMNL